MQASSESGLLCSSNGASASGRLWIGQTVWPVLASCSTMWRWLKVPRSVSWPVSRIGVPSVSSEANASASACAQSMPRRVGAPSASRRRSSCLTSLGWTVKPSGTRSSSLPSSRSALGGHRGLDFGLGERSSWYSPVPLAAAVLGGGRDLRLQPLVQEREVVPHLLPLLLDLLVGDDPVGDQPLGPQLRDALLPLILAYISGCV